jgi:hypothetical protein
MSDFSLMVNLRAKYAQQDALVLQRVQEYQAYQRDFGQPMTWDEVVEERDFFSPLYWDDGVRDGVQAYCAYLFYAKPFGEKDSEALRWGLFRFHIHEQETTFEKALADLTEDLVETRYLETEKEDSHKAA